MLATSDQHDVTLERKGLNRVLCYAHFIRCDSLESLAFVWTFFPRPSRAMHYLIMVTIWNVKIFILSFNFIISCSTRTSATGKFINKQLLSNYRLDELAPRMVCQSFLRRTHRSGR